MKKLLLLLLISFSLTSSAGVLNLNCSSADRVITVPVTINSETKQVKFRDIVSDYQREGDYIYWSSFSPPSKGIDVPIWISWYFNLKNGRIKTSEFWSGHDDSFTKYCVKVPEE